MADAGVASRRECERLIEEGHVTVNDKRVTKLPVFVDPGSDKVLVDGRPLPRISTRPTYIMLYKPSGALAATRDDSNLEIKRKTLSDLVDHPDKARLFPVGRLEFNASGLVLLTSDGDLAHLLTHPRFGVTRTYEALVKRRLSQRDLEQMELAFLPRLKKSEMKAAAAAPQPPSPVKLTLVKHDADRSLIEITLREGPNRQVADVLARLGCPVKKLRRIAIGPLRLRAVALGSWRELDRSEIVAIKKAAKRAAGPSTSKAPTSQQPRRVARGGGGGGGGAVKGPREGRRFPVSDVSSKDSAE
jgi:23S rRNA pseudouridine2605 synthase